MKKKLKNTPEIWVESFNFKKKFYKRLLDIDHEKIIYQGETIAIPEELSQKCVEQFKGCYRRYDSSIDYNFSAYTASQSIQSACGIVVCGDIKYCIVYYGN